MPAATPRTLWGGAIALFERRRTGWPDIVLPLMLAGALYAGVEVAHEWTGTLRPVANIDLSFASLPLYTLYSLARGLAAYLLSLVFTVVYGTIAARSRAAERVLVPLLDILQSIPVLGFMPALVLACIALFPHSNAGLELAAVIMIFTGQAWNMTFSFYTSLVSVPNDLREAARAYRFSPWRVFTRVEVPFATTGLVWNSMMSMAGGWFFLMINEAFVLGAHDFRLPGVGSYMSVAVAQGNVPAALAAVASMMLMIIGLDMLLWRPLVVFAQRFRIEESSSQTVSRSQMLDMLNRSELLQRAAGVLRTAHARLLAATRRPPREDGPSPLMRKVTGGMRFLGMVAATGLAVWAAWHITLLLIRVPFPTWMRIGVAGALTLSRVLAAVAIGTLWAVPAGLAIGLSPVLSRRLQPVVQVLAAFPAPMLYPAVVWLLSVLGIGIGTGSIVLMLLGAQWYILFNVSAGAMSVPSDLRACADSFRITGVRRWKRLYLPAIFPSLITGWVTAAGGAWNASIVSEYVHAHGSWLVANGLGSMVSTAAADGDFPALAASVVAMSAIVVIFNRLVWKRLYAFSRERFSLGSF